MQTNKQDSNNIPSNCATSQSARSRRQKSSPSPSIMHKKSQTIVILAVLLAGVIVPLILAQTSVANANYKWSLTGLKHHHERRIKRSLYELPDGAEFLLAAETPGNGRRASSSSASSGHTSGQLRTTFSCDGLGYGYYADPDNDCKIFHVCQSFRMSDGSIYNNHWSFICGNQTVFNQVTLSCSHPEDAVPCENAKDFYHVNDYFGDVQAPSVKQEDLNQAQDLVSRAYGSRISANTN